VSAEAPARPSLRGFGFLGVTALAWGLNWPVMKAVMAEWPPYTVRVFAAAIAIAVLVTIGRAQRATLWPRRGQWSRLALGGLLNVGAWSIVAPLAFYWLDASEAAIIAYTMPVWATILAWPILGERPTLLRIAALALGLAGVVLLMGGTWATQGTDALIGKLPGVAAILGTALMFATGAVITKRWPVQMAPAPMLAWQLAFGAAVPAIIALFFESLDLARVTWVGWACLLYLGLAAQCLAFFSWFAALRLLPAGVAATGNLMVPVVGVLSSGWLLGESLGLRHAAALALTLGAVVLVARGR